MPLDFKSQILVEMSLPGGRGIGRRRRAKLKPIAFAVSLSSLGRGENLQYRAAPSRHHQNRESVAARSVTCQPISIAELVIKSIVVEHARALTGFAATERFAQEGAVRSSIEFSLNRLLQSDIVVRAKRSAQFVSSAEQRSSITSVASRSCSG